ncbi:MAG: hypothetical protein AB7O62_24315, partial [Pirellulales bacterium]
AAYQTPVGVLLLELALVQAKNAWTAWRKGTAATLQLPRQPLFWRYQASGPVVCYLVSLLQGPGERALFLFLASSALWLTLGLLPLVLNHQTLQFWNTRLAGRKVRLAGWASFLLLAAGVLIESTVQMLAVATGGQLPGAYVAHCCSLAPGMDLRGRPVNERGYWYQHAPGAAGLLKVAALGDSMLLAGSHDSNHLTQAERSVPGAVIYNFGRPRVGPREYAAQFERDVANERPDLVLAYISIGDDICQPIPAPSLMNFDWRGLGAVQWSVSSLTIPGSGPAHSASMQPPVEREEFLQTAASRLAVCRTPIAPELQRHWEQTFSHLESMARLCQRHGSTLALVLVPGEFQVSPTLCDSLRRHAGYEQGQIDLELPQRRLMEFAARRDLPVLDLLPYLRASHESPYERNDIHWNDRGNAIAANALAHWLQRQYGPQVAANDQAQVIK